MNFQWICGALRLHLTCIAVSVGLTCSAIAAGPDVLTQDQALDDWRIEPLKDLNGYFPLVPSDTKHSWHRRAERIRHQMTVALGLWPLPTKTPLNPVIHGKIDKGSYTVEKVYFQSHPGFYVTGNLYRPTGIKGKKPGILCPHGHGGDGRFRAASSERIKELIKSGDEVFENGGRSPLQARCVTLARMGCVVFHYDMLGYADSQQLSYELVHRFAKQRPAANSSKNWGLFSPQAESNLQSAMGLQTWNGIRSLDFIESLPDVDPDRIAVTGDSGGGTQTMVLGAIDPRPKTIVPAVMVSTSMQGGCTCENSCLLRIGTGNVEFAALFAPKPQMLIAADDWTREFPTKGFPDLQKLYAMLDAEEAVELVAHLQFKHNYNYVNRAAMYQWMNRQLDIGHRNEIVERDYDRLSKADLTVWNDEHPQPLGGAIVERTLLRRITNDTREQLAAAAPKDAESLAQYKRLVGPALDVVIGRNLPDHKAIDYKETTANDSDEFRESAGLLSLSLDYPFADRPKRKEQMPIAFLYPKKRSGQVVVWVSPRGKAGLYGEDGSVIEPVKALLEAGSTVVGVDLLFQGESHTGDKPIERTRRVKETDEAAAYTFGYNRPLFARRVHDLLTVLSYVRNHNPTPREIVVVGCEKESGPLVAAARAQALDVVDRAVIHTHGFRFGQVNDLHSTSFLPGGAKYDDLPGMLTIAAPLPLYLVGEGQGEPSLVVDAYRAGGHVDRLHVADGDSATWLEDAVAWVLKPEK